MASVTEIRNRQSTRQFEIRRVGPDEGARNDVVATEEPLVDESSPVWGGVLVALGMLFLLRNLGWIQFAFVAKWWPILLVAAGVVFVMRSLRGSSNDVQG